MKKAYTVSLVAMIVSAVMAFGLAGCEDASNDSLSINPSSVMLDTADAGANAQVFVADASTNFVGTNMISTLFYPLEWSVSDPGLGNIAGQGGDSAVYTRTTGRGSNVITVRDASGREGVAVVTQK